MFKNIQNQLKKVMKLKYDFNPLLRNRVILYFLLFLVIIDSIYFLNTKDFYSFATLILVGFLTSFFSKNMTVIFVIALVVTHILKFGKSSYEGMEEMPESPETVDKTADTDEEKKEKKESFSDKKDEKVPPKIEYDDLKKDFTEFQNIQDKILKGMTEIDPLLQKAEAFITKFEGYKEQTKADKENK